MSRVPQPQRGDHDYGLNLPAPTPEQRLLELAVMEAARALNGSYGERVAMPERILVWRKDHDKLCDAIAALDAYQDQHIAEPK